MNNHAKTIPQLARAELRDRARHDADVHITRTLKPSVTLSAGTRQGRPALQVGPWGVVAMMEAEAAGAPE